MAGFDFQRFSNSLRGRARSGGPPPMPRGPGDMQPAPYRRDFSWGMLVRLAVASAIVYAGYFWFVRRLSSMPTRCWCCSEGRATTASPATRSSSRTRPSFPGGRDAWEKEYGDCNGIVEAGLPHRHVLRLQPLRLRARGRFPIAEVPPGKVGIVIKKFGEPLDDGPGAGRPGSDQRGPLPGFLPAGRVHRVRQPVRLRGEADRSGQHRPRLPRRRHGDGRAKSAEAAERVSRRPTASSGVQPADRARRLPLHQPLRTAHHARSASSRSGSR